MVTSTSKYGSRGRPLADSCTTPRDLSTSNFGISEPRKKDRPTDRGLPDPERFFREEIFDGPVAGNAVPIRGTTFSPRAREEVGAGAAQ